MGRNRNRHPRLVMDQSPQPMLHRLKPQPVIVANRDHRDRLDHQAKTGSLDRQASLDLADFPANRRQAPAMCLLSHPVLYVRLDRLDRMEHLVHLEMLERLDLLDPLEKTVNWDKLALADRLDRLVSRELTVRQETPVRMRHKLH